MKAISELTPVQRQFSDFGRRMMQAAPGIRDDVKSNLFARVGSMLTTVGAAYGAREQDFTPEYREVIQEAERMFAHPDA